LSSLLHLATEKAGEGREVGSDHGRVAKGPSGLATRTVAEG
jgi:hypothetical protein